MNIVHLNTWWLDLRWMAKCWLKYWHPRNQILYSRVFSPQESGLFASLAPVYLQCAGHLGNSNDFRWIMSHKALNLCIEKRKTLHALVLPVVVKQLIFVAYTQIKMFISPITLHFLSCQNLTLTHYTELQLNLHVFEPIYSFISTSCWNSSTLFAILSNPPSP